MGHLSGLGSSVGLWGREVGAWGRNRYKTVKTRQDTPLHLTFGRVEEAEMVGPGAVVAVERRLGDE